MIAFNVFIIAAYQGNLFQEKRFCKLCSRSNFFRSRGFQLWAPPSVGTSTFQKVNSTEMQVRRLQSLAQSWCCFSSMCAARACMCLIDTRVYSVICQPQLLCVRSRPHFVPDRVGCVQTAADIESGKPIYINGKHFGTSDNFTVPKGQWSATLALLVAGVLFVAPILGFMSVRTREETMCLQYLRL